jgi:hypothetical protein
MYKMTNEGLESHPVSTFGDLGVFERADLQRRLRDDIRPLGLDLLVIAEEFGEWEDARRRIDLLAIDRDGHLVVIELKRTEDGGHMELQALRYAAMVSSMTFDEVAATYEGHCKKHPAPSDENADSRTSLVDFLGTPAGDEPVISTEVRILLVSADFGREITTAVLWLNGFDGMDIRCVRLIPYKVGDQVLIDIQQVLPLPEAADYQVKIRRKDAAAAKAHADGKDYTKYHVIVDGVEMPAENKRNAVKVMVQELVKAGAAPSAIREALPLRVMKALPGEVSPGQPVIEALLDTFPGVDTKRWFVDDPLYDATDQQTYVLFNNWGLSNTEATLSSLVARFSDKGITFRPAAGSGAVGFESAHGDATP